MKTYPWTSFAAARARRYAYTQIIAFMIDMCRKELQERVITTNYDCEDIPPSEQCEIDALETIKLLFPFSV